jgi:hypothetical protein
METVEYVERLTGLFGDDLGFHLSEQTKRNAWLRALPNQRKNRSSVFTVRFSPTHRSRLQWPSLW